jgi:hypothetical protein
VPIEIGRIYDLTYRSTGFYGSFQFSLETDLNDNFYEEESDYTGVPQFNNTDVFFGFQNYRNSGGWLDTYDKEVDVIDNDIGRITTYTNLDCTRNRRRIIFYQEGAEELNEFLKWVYRRAGRYRPFYAPTWNRDLELDQSGIIGSTLDVINEGFGSCNETLAIRRISGEWFIRNIQGVSEQPGGILRLTLDNSLGIDSSEVERISFLKQYSLLRDEVEIRHFGNFTSECELDIEERFS